VAAGLLEAVHHAAHLVAAQSDARGKGAAGGGEPAQILHLVVLFDAAGLDQALGEGCTVLCDVRLQLVLVAVLRAAHEVARLVVEAREIHAGGEKGSHVAGIQARRT
jgi:hypothetical protein